MMLYGLPDGSGYNDIGVAPRYCRRLYAVLREAESDEAGVRVIVTLLNIIFGKLRLFSFTFTNKHVNLLTRRLKYFF